MTEIIEEYKRHRTLAGLAILIIGINVILGVSFGLSVYLGGLILIAGFVQEQAESLLFLMALSVAFGWVMRLHFSSDPDYKNFKLQLLLCNPDGTPNPRNCSLWLATISGLYFCFYLLGHDRQYFVQFATWFLGILFAYAGVTEVFKKRDADQPPLKGGLAQ